MKNQVLFSSKDECKKLKCGLLQFLFVALRVNRKKKSIHFRCQDCSKDASIILYYSFSNNNKTVFTTYKQHY